MILNALHLNVCIFLQVRDDTGKLLPTYGQNFYLLHLPLFIGANSYSSATKRYWHTVLSCATSVYAGENAEGFEAEKEGM